MKRSEMINLIAETHADYLFIIENSNPIQYPSLEFGEFLLSKIEQAGTTPPAVKVPCPTYFQDAMGQVRQGEDSWTYVNKWEEE